LCPYNKEPTKSTGEGIRNKPPRIQISEEQRCKWCVTLEELTAGWIILHAACAHSDHPMGEARGLSEAERTCTHSKYKSKIPDQLIDLVTPYILLITPLVEQISHFINLKAKELDIKLA
jgi:hypothetical protein